MAKKPSKAQIAARKVKKAGRKRGPGLPKGAAFKAGKKLAAAVGKKREVLFRPAGK